MNRPVGVISLAGPDGFGKSHVSRRTALPVLCLFDDFYKDGDDPTLPRSDARVDRGHTAGLNASAALDTIARLTPDGEGEVPVYAISEDCRIGTLSRRFITLAQAGQWDAVRPTASRTPA